MIKINNLSVTYKNRKVLDIDKLELPDKGLIVFNGPSGCGKSTLLNSISGVINYQGEILIDNLNLQKYSDEYKSEYRLRNIGFIFQDFKLYGSETVAQNIMLPFESSLNTTKRLQKRRYLDLKKLVNLDVDDNAKVTKLSGGEKQRVAIARALINDPKIILADEPTGALDETNATNVFSILKKISATRLVIVVSHDFELVQQFADLIFTMRDGVIIDSVNSGTYKNSKFIPILKIKKKHKKISLPSSFLLKHNLNYFKSNKVKSLLSTLITSFGLLGAGMSVVISSLITKNMTNAYSSIVGENSVVVSKKEEVEVESNITSMSTIEVESFASHYPEYIIDTGEIFYANFEDYFVDKNEVYVASSTYRTLIEGITVRHINEFHWLDFENPHTYPHSFTSLEDDEIIFGLTINMIYKLCLSLRIERTIASLSTYLSNNNLYVCFDLENKSWQYSDEQMFNMVGFVLVNRPCIYHTNHHWNSLVLHDWMRFPYTDDLQTEYSLPWMMYKIDYLQTDNNTADFLFKAYQEPYADYLILEVGNTDFLPLFYQDVKFDDRHRVLVFDNYKRSIPYRYALSIKENSKYLSSPIIGSNKGYTIFKDSLLLGFANKTYFSFNSLLLDETIDQLSTYSLSSNEQEQLSDEVACGHFTIAQQSGVTFKPLCDDTHFIKGRPPNDINEIAVSSKLIEKIGGNFDVFQTPLLISTVSKENQISGNKIQREFITDNLKVVGVVKDNYASIYHNCLWSVVYYQVRLGFSAFDLTNNCMAFQIDNTDHLKLLSKEFEMRFPNYEISYPMDDAIKSVNQVASYVGIALLIFSITTIIISIFIIILTTFLHLHDNRKDIALARCLGINKKEASKFVIYHLLIQCLFSFIISCIELFLISIVINYFFTNKLIISFNYLAPLLMLGVDIFVCFISAIFVLKPTLKVEPIEALKK